MAWGVSQSEGPLLAIHFEESGTNGYLFVKNLDRGKDGLAVLIRSVDTGELAVRKFPLLNVADEPAAINRSKWLPSKEVIFMKALTQTGLTPRYISVEGSEKLPRSFTMQYCNGDTVWDYYCRYLAHAARKEREAFFWLVLGEMIRTMCFLFSGHTHYVPPSVTFWTDRVPKGKFVPPPPEFQPWLPIQHSDCHMCNVFLTFAPESPTPRVLLADFSRADHRHNFLWGAANPELVEMDVFMQAFLGLHPRPSLEIDRKLAEIRRQMETGTTLLQLCQGGLYELCMQNFLKQEATLPVPLAASRKDLPKVFDLSKGSFGYIANLWSLRQALEGGIKYYKVLQIPRQDVCERGEVSVARATALSMVEIMKLTDNSDKSSEADSAECDKDPATIDLDRGVCAQQIPV